MEIRQSFKGKGSSKAALPADKGLPRGGRWQGRARRTASPLSGAPPCLSADNRGRRSLPRLFARGLGSELEALEAIESFSMAGGLFLPLGKYHLCITPKPRRSNVRAAHTEQAAFVPRTYLQMGPIRKVGSSSVVLSSVFMPFSPRFWAGGSPFVLGSPVPVAACPGVTM